MELALVLHHVLSTVWSSKDWIRSNAEKMASRNSLTLRMIDRIFCIPWEFWRNLVSMLYNFIFLRTTHNLYSLTIATFLYLHDIFYTAIQLASCSPHHSLKQKLVLIPGRRRIKSPITVRFPDPKTIFLKQLEEWHVIVSCDQLGETLQAAPTLLHELRESIVITSTN